MADLHFVLAVGGEGGDVIGDAIIQGDLTALDSEVPTPAPITKPK